MDKVLRRHWERRQRMSAFFAKPSIKPLVLAQADVAADVVTFNTDAAAWEVKLVEVQVLEGNADAAMKKAAVTTMAETTTRWGQRCVVKLRRLGLMTEAVEVNHTPSEVMGMSGPMAIATAKAIRSVLNTNMAALSGQGVTAAVIADIDAKINAAALLLTKPAASAGDLEAKRAALAAGDAMLEAELEDIVGTLHAEYRYTKPDFDREMMVQYELGGDTGKRYTGIQGTAKSSVAVLAGYTVRREDDHAKKGVVDRQGAYHIKGMMAGDVVFELVDKAGVVVATKLLVLKLGTVVVWDWVI